MRISLKDKRGSSRTKLAKEIGIISLKEGVSGPTFCFSVSLGGWGTVPMSLSGGRLEGLSGAINIMNTKVLRSHGELKKDMVLL